MVAQLLWILAVYGIAVALIHIMHARQLRRADEGTGRRRHYVLITSNHERQVEWYLRALSWYALLSGTRVRVTVLDDQSYDDTLKIVQRLTHLSGIELVYGTWRSDDSTREVDADPNEEEVIRIDLRNPMEAVRIPYVQG
ncbi:hypothetical protein M4D81_33460 [Paenibacillus sp. p3-SID867]|uniref:hypothetical protein n=1 Tax=Paenibacillus sp. p3-SID867 TaxID=2916363 RepID=UPI0021A8CCAA|nr:hypothetical protein [Paenibacillus sp. p3-SID867]MCT1403917.1 hypothetical protein [Paenibacillus sp. p3-SID867]